MGEGGSTHCEGVFPCLGMAPERINYAVSTCVRENVLSLFSCRYQVTVM